MDNLGEFSQRGALHGGRINPHLRLCEMLGVKVLCGMSNDLTTADHSFLSRQQAQLTEDYICFRLVSSTQQNKTLGCPNLMRN